MFKIGQFLSFWPGYVGTSLWFKLFLFLFCFKHVTLTCLLIHYFHLSQFYYPLWFIQMFPSWPFHLSLSFLLELVGVGIWASWQLSQIVSCSNLSIVLFIQITVLFLVHYGVVVILVLILIYFLLKILYWHYWKLIFQKTYCLLTYFLVLLSFPRSVNSVVSASGIWASYPSTVLTRALFLIFMCNHIPHSKLFAT